MMRTTFSNQVLFAEYRGLPVRSRMPRERFGLRKFLSLLPQIIGAALTVGMLLMMMGALGVFALGIAG